jgi:hypothetical protein
MIDYDPSFEECPDVERFIWKNVSQDRDGRIVVAELSIEDLKDLIQLCQGQIQQLCTNVK